MLSELRTLEPTELECVRLEASAMLSISGSSRSPRPTSQNRLTNPILDGVMHELKRRGILFREPAIRRRYPEAIEASEELIAYLEARFKFKPAEWSALGQLLAKVLADWLEPKFPVSSNMMFRNVDKMLVALDRAFPGYLHSGLLPFLWKGHG